MVRRLAIFAISLMALIGAGRVQAASLTPVVFSESVPVGAIIPVELRLDSQGQVINAVEVTVVYDAAVLQPVELAGGSSFFPLWVERPAVTQPGRIAMTAGIPDGTVVQDGSITTLLFRALRSGQAVVAVQPGASAVYLHDGLGTTAELNARSATISVSDTPSVLANPVITSHLDAGAWSTVQTVILQWQAFEQSVVSYDLSPDPLHVTDEVVEANTGFASFPNLGDGIWYLTFRERFSGQEWSQPYRRAILIDTTPPEAFSLNVIDGDRPGDRAVAFSTNDWLSGIAGYSVSIDRAAWWMPWQTKVDEFFTDGPFTIDDYDSVKTLTVTAYDAAGNATSAVRSFSTGEAKRFWLLLGLISGSIVLLLFLFLIVHRQVVRRGLTR